MGERRPCACVEPKIPANAHPAMNASAVECANCGGLDPFARRFYLARPDARQDDRARADSQAAQARPAKATT